MSRYCDIVESWVPITPASRWTPKTFRPPPNACGPWHIPCGSVWCNSFSTEKLTVGELAEACDIPSHMASEHLRMMQHCGLLTRRQDGRRIYYQAAEPTLERIMDCIESRFGTESV